MKKSALAADAVPFKVYGDALIWCEVFPRKANEQLGYVEVFLGEYQKSFMSDHYLVLLTPKAAIKLHRVLSAEIAKVRRLVTARNGDRDVY
ncbi:hypothetical protein ACFWY9_35785 [Amycolatopsis sp. NPDC059027]|uniref:hypothetical protein n=1 Tax=Amycolatopsis sp. NPDC059027 TaxID=3346709 RepID=UPI00366C05E7